MRLSNDLSLSRRIKRFGMLTALSAIGFGLLFVPAALADFGFAPGSVDFTITNQDGSPVTQAGSHPFQVTTKFEFNLNEHGLLDGAAKDISAAVPPGLVGDATAVSQCSSEQFLTKRPANRFNDALYNGADCPDDTQVGYATVQTEPKHPSRAYTIPIYNLAPPRGLPAEFGFEILETAIFLRPTVRSNGDYGLTVGSEDTSQLIEVLGATIALWGVPSDPAHDDMRGDCLNPFLTNVGETSGGPLGQLCPLPPSDLHTAFLTVPTSCNGPTSTTVRADSWENIGADLPDGEPDLSDPNWLRETIVSHDAHGNPIGADGCEKLGFTPTTSAAPSTDRASAPSGLDFNIDVNDPGLTNPEGLAQSQIKKVSVTLPEGLTINPSAGVGLGGCTPADYANETVSSAPGAGCPNDSKLGEVTIETPLLSVPIHGSLFIAQPHENPFDSLVALYIVAKSPETGILIKLAGEVTPNPSTGQLVTTFDNNPQLPFDHFNFHFREGQQAPLISPAACGTYTTQADLTPWSDPTATLSDTSQFTITKGFDGGACPTGGVPPFHPQLQAGTLNNNANSYSPLYVHLTRTDAEQEISSFSTNLPPGLTGNLSGIPFCPEANIALARTKTGAQEEASPSCPAASQIGHTLVGTGVGAVLAYVPGKVYLAGPYHGDPFSLVSVTSAVVGPFDLGTVVIRFALRIDPHTAQVSVDPSASEPIPHIIQGIVTHVRDIRVYIDRGNFTLNPTSCTPAQITSTLSSNHGQSTTVATPFQAANCAKLAFAPKLTAFTQGKTSKAGGASLKVKIAYPSAGSYANIHSVKVDLPKQLPSRLTTLQKACTAAQFEANPAGCPAASIVGHATATTPILPVPLNGPAYFVSHGGEAFPSLIVVLQGYGVTVDLVGTTFISKAGITSSTFKQVPDVPVGSFEITLPEGKFSALAANGNLCKTKLTMPTAINAQNGAAIKQSTKIAVTGCPKAHKAKKARRAKHKRKRK